MHLPVCCAVALLNCLLFRFELSYSFPRRCTLQLPVQLQITKRVHSRLTSEINRSLSTRFPPVESSSVILGIFCFENRRLYELAALIATRVQSHSRACRASLDRHAAKMPVEACSKKHLSGIDLPLIEISPSGSDTDPELRYRCPVEGSCFLGATTNHASDCLKHILDPKQDVAGHARFLSLNLVTFRTAQGKPALHSRPAVPASFTYSDTFPGTNQHAYMKVCQAQPDRLYGLCS